MEKNISVLISVVLLVGLIMPKGINGQEINLKIGIRDSIKSEVLHDTKKILIHLPDSYFKSNKSYPVIYQVRGDTASMIEMVSTINRLALGDEIIPEMIIISIETVGGKDMWPTNTMFYPKPETIGINDFQSFIEIELIPFVEKKYRTTDDRILYGQSMTAVFTIYTFITNPKLFNSYIASSGAFPDCENYFKEISLRSFQQIDQFDGQKIFITNGLKDPLAAQVNSFQQITDFSSLVKEKLGNRVLYKYLTYEDEGHVPFYSLYDGLRFIYKVR
ncbi:MAG: alpha/beta hydrolase [Tenuifilaceae bacterium]